MKFLNDFFRKVLQNKSKILLVIYFAALCIVTFKVYEHVFRFYVTACFNELGPVSRSMPVYYKGFRIGKTGRITPGLDFKSTSVKIIFNSDMSLLPENVTAKVRKFDGGDKSAKNHYIEIEYPEIPTKRFLKKGDVISGKTEPDIASFMSAQVESGALGTISDNAGKAMMSVQKTSDSLRDLIEDVKGVLDAARPDILAAAGSMKQAMGNTAQITSELNELSFKLNKSVKKQGVDEAVSNIGKTIENIEQITENINNATTNLGQTMGKLDSSIEGLNSVVSDVKSITGGVEETMSKRFGGARLILGTPVGCTEK
ncbi:MAG: hypothetical protein LBK53_03290 [Heliobacteriaceae bacterium]|jgi:ABC-type transporter Mla subunit MlaD|nr:hypothetical protein [Heliobacteriaceae bacterium]